MVKTKNDRFMQALEHVYSGVTQYIRAMINDDEAARDLLAETVLIAYEHFDTLRKPYAFSRYVYVIAKRLCKRWKRREKLFVRLRSHHEALAADYQSHENNTELAHILNIMNTLPTRQKETLVLFYLSDLSQEEIRRIQGGTLSGVKSRIAAGKKQLATILMEPILHPAHHHPPQSPRSKALEL
jgi:RNA polymerase sigma factor (sigma-70 family)